MTFELLILGSTPIVDAHLEKEVSQQAIILKKSIFEPYQLASFFSKNKIISSARQKVSRSIGQMEV